MATSNRHFPILFIMDIKKCKLDQYGETMGIMEYMETKMNEHWRAQILSCKPLQQYVVKVPSKKTSLLLHELAYLGSIWQLKQECGLEVAFLDWQTFRDLMLDDSPEGRDSIARNTCAIIGGVDLALQIKPEDYGLQGAKFDRYVQSLQELGKQVTLWPHIDEQVEASKVHQVELLDLISRTVTKSHHPKTFLITPRTGIEVINGMVLKREGGEASNHVILPHHGHFPKTQKELHTLRLRSLPYRWLAQEYVPFLQTVGEWRVFFCGGRPIFTIQTEPDARHRHLMRFDMHQTCLPLWKMKQIMEENPKFVADDIMSWPFATLDEQNAGHAELMTFAQRTYNALREADRLKFKHDFLCLDLWCRLDISIVEVQNQNRLEFFCNEVEKFQSTCVWGRLGGPEHPIEHLALESAQVLYKYLKQHYILIDK